MRILRHIWARTRLDAFIDNELPAELAARVQRHIDECEMCRSDVVETLGLQAILRDSVRLRPDAEAVARLEEWARTELPSAVD